MENLQDLHADIKRLLGVLQPQVEKQTETTGERERIDYYKRIQLEKLNKKSLARTNQK